MSNLEILDVQFLVPARVVVKHDGVERVEAVSIDMANKRVYTSDGTVSLMEEIIFAWLDRENTLPDDFFTASDEIQEKAQEVYGDIENKRQQVAEVGENGW